MTENKIIKSQKKSNIKVGDKFTRWTVLENMGIIKACTRFKCECKCGNIKIVSGSALYSGHTKSCGCFGREQHTTHGMSGTPTYLTWQGMKSRCTNPNNARYKDYGGRGITVCKEWLYSFEAFFKDIGERPEGLTIERKNNELGYFKQNCRWATHTEQTRNCRISKNNKTGINGIIWNKRCQKYVVGIGVDYKNIHIGYFKKLKDAKAARIAAEQKYWK